MSVDVAFSFKFYLRFRIDIQPLAISLSREFQYIKLKKRGGRGKPLVHSAKDLVELSVMFTAITKSTS